MLDETLSIAWAGAVTAARDEASAQDAVVRAIAELGPQADALQVRRRAVRIALQTAPAPAFATLPTRERCAIGLARLASATPQDIAAETGWSADEARALITAALRRLARPTRPRLALVA
jgi:DNA-directed RNA polymerase specialized sigma24 family protein